MKTSNDVPVSGPFRLIPPTGSGGLRFCRLLVGFLVLLALPACQKSIRELNAVEKARLTRSLAKDAADCYQRWMRSDLQDLEALECYTRKYEETTEIHPSPMSCQSCYYHYAKGMRLLGVYFWEEEKRALETLREAPPDAASLREKARRAREKWQTYFARSNETLETYFSTRNGIDVETYDWASQQYAALGNYGKALAYLNRLDRSITFNERDRETIEERRRVYKREYERQQLEEVRRSLADG